MCFQASLIYVRSDHSLSEQLVLNTSLFSRSINDEGNRFDNIDAMYHWQQTYSSH